MRYVLLLMLMLAWQAPLNAADIYADPQNLKILPKDISSEDLRNAMRNFSLSTGARCSNCHVGEEGQSLDTYDFASDEKPLKDKARAMMQMLGRINLTLNEAFGDEHVRVDCVTCHRGVSKPKMLAAELTEAADKDGVQGIRDRYQSLRQRYYGTHSYDFSDLTLTEFAQSRVTAGHPDQAYAVLDLLLAENPQSFQGHFAYAELARMQGDTATAKKYYEQALELNPRAAGFVQQRIDALQEEP